MFRPSSNVRSSLSVFSSAPSRNRCITSLDPTKFCCPERDEREVILNPAQKTNQSDTVRRRSQDEASTKPPDPTRVQIRHPSKSTRDAVLARVSSLFGFYFCWAALTKVQEQSVNDGGWNATFVQRMQWGVNE
jgi:hypothetical protein